MIEKYDFSVVVACYNPDMEKLKNTLNSIVKQIDVSYEIIIADDGSAEKYEDKLKEYFYEIGFENVTYSFLEVNQGTVINLYKAVQLAKGEYIKTISPGDYLYDEYTLKHYGEIFKKRDAEVVFGRAQFYTPDMKLIKNAAPNSCLMYHNLSIKRNLLLYHDYILGAAIAAKKDAFNCLTPLLGTVKFEEDIPLTFLTIINGKKIAACNKKVVWYETGLGISTNERTKKLVCDDSEAFFNYLLQVGNRYAKKSVKTYKIIRSTNGRLKRILKIILCSPLFPIFVVIRKISMLSLKNSDINMLYKIISKDK